MKRYGRSGWYGERHRHYLASKGVKTKRYTAFKLLDKNGYPRELERGQEIVKVPIQRAKIMRMLGDEGVKPAWGEGLTREDALNKFGEEKLFLESKGYVVAPPRVRETSRGWIVAGRVRRTPEKLREQIEETMYPMHGSDSSGAMSDEDAEKYIARLTEAVKSEEEGVRIPTQFGSDRVRWYDTPFPGEQIAGRFGVLQQGRHRILAAERAGLKRFPIIVSRDLSREHVNPAQGMNESEE